MHKYRYICVYECRCNEKGGCSLAAVGAVRESVKCPFIHELARHAVAVTIPH